MFGLFYFVFASLINVSKSIKELFMLTMFFLPGFTFPISTLYFNLRRGLIRKLIHLTLSITIYYAVANLFTFENQIKFITILAGLIGAFLFHLMTKFLLIKQIEIKHTILLGFISSLAFLPYEVWGKGSVLMGFALFSWTLINGIFINQLLKKI
ncbi:hypothetical protein CH361_04360 [Leptospira brenneri]|nr:hypothetical protein CH361_04360 [Leptospira brenneri]